MSHLSKYLAAYARHIRGSQAFGLDYSDAAEQERGHLVRPDPRPGAYPEVAAAEDAPIRWGSFVDGVEPLEVVDVVQRR